MAKVFHSGVGDRTRHRRLASSPASPEDCCDDGLPPKLALPTITKPQLGSMRGPSSRPREHSSRDSTALRILTLGTAAGPVVWRGRTGISTVIVVEGVSYMVDAGIGSAQRYRQLGLRWEDLRHIFITHMHSDHYLELPHALLVPWELPGESYTDTLSIWGPGAVPLDLPHQGPPGQPTLPRRVENVASPIPGISEVVDGILGSAFQGDLNIRYVDEDHADIREFIQTRDLQVPKDAGADYATRRCPPMDPFKVFEDDRVKVTATLVDHRFCFPAFAYRFDTEHGSVVCSGDTRPNDNLLRLAADSDLLLHESIHLDHLLSELKPAPGLMEGLLANWEERHTLHSVVGKVAQSAGVSNLALSHLAPAHTDVVSDDEWLEHVRRDFRGGSVVGHDLHEIRLVERPGRRKDMQMRPAKGVL